jgi:hypothetical protein
MTGGACSGGVCARAAHAAVIAGVMALIWTAYTLAQVGRFSAPPVLAGAALAAGLAALVVVRRARGAPSPAEPPPASARVARGVAVGIAGAAFALALPPSETLLGGWDPGVYLHTGAEVARTGGLRFEHPDVAAVPEPDRPLLYRHLHGEIWEPWGGMRMLPDGRISPQFYHAYPAVLAVAHAVGGWRAMLWVNPLWAALGVWAFYALLRRWFSPGWSAAGAALLAFNPASLWQARFSTAEPQTQALLLAGFALFARAEGAARARPGAGAGDAAAAGAALGLAMLTRYDTLIALAAAAPVLIGALAARRAPRTLAWTLAVAGALAAQAWAHQRWVAPYYSPLGPSVVRALAALAILTVAGAAALATGAGRRWADRWAAAPGPRRAGAVLLVGWLLFCWIVRPELGRAHAGTAWLQARIVAVAGEAFWTRLAGPEANAVRYLADVLGPGLLALAALGIAGLLLRLRGTAAACAWVAAVATLGVLTWSPFNELFLMWVIRRYVPLALPFLCLGAVAATVALARRLERRLPAHTALIAAALVLAAAAAVRVGPAVRIARAQEWPGLGAWFEQELLPRIPGDAVVYSDQPGFAAPLRFLWRVPAFEMRTGRRNGAGPEHHALLRRRAAGGENVWLLSQCPPPDDAGWTSVAAVPLESRILQTPRRGLPDGFRPRGGAFVLYRMDPAPPGP